MHSHVVCTSMRKSMGESMNNKFEEKRGKKALHVNPQTQITYTLYTFRLYVLESLSADI